MYRSLAGAVLTVVLLCLAGCGTADEAPAALVAAPSAPFGGTPIGSRDIGRVPGTTRVSFLLALRDPRASARQRALARMYDPHSRTFGRFQSSSQWRALGPAPVEVRAVQHVLQMWGMASTWQPGNTWLSVSGPAGAVARLFRVRIDRFLGPHHEHLWAAVSNPTVPSVLRRAVTGMGRISNFSDRRIHIVPVNGLSPTNVLAAYDIKPLRSSGLDGSGETVSFIEIDGVRQSDFDAFTQHFGLPAMHPQVVAGPHLSNVDGEAEMDMEVVHEIAPGATLKVYNCSSNCSNGDLINLESRVVADNAHGIVSISLGGCEPGESRTDANSERATFDRADAQGESVFVASGDSGAYECLTENWGAPPTDQYLGASSPASMPGVTAVGGTRLEVRKDGTWLGEQAWEEPAATAGTGGGMSVYFRRPSWQTGTGVQTGSGAMRQVPDVSGAADPLSSITVDIGGQFIQEGGTSQAAPIWAGITALIDQYLQKHQERVAGFLNPALYPIAAGTPPYPAFHDVTVGTNLKYAAGPGYDMATGLGTPDAWDLARDLARYIKQGHP